MERLKQQKQKEVTMEQQQLIGKKAMDAIMASCMLTGMECNDCGRNNVHFLECENGDETTVDIACSNCQKTFVVLQVVDDTKLAVKGCGDNCTCSAPPLE